MPTPFHERFAEALRKALPAEGFTVHADRTLVQVTYRTEPGAFPATLAALLPSVMDKRRPVHPSDVHAWVVGGAVARLRRDMAYYTPEARASAQAMLDALTKHGLIPSTDTAEKPKAEPAQPLTIEVEGGYDSPYPFRVGVNSGASYVGLSGSNQMAVMSSSAPHVVFGLSLTPDQAEKIGRTLIEHAERVRNLTEKES